MPATNILRRMLPGLTATKAVSTSESSRGEEQGRIERLEARVTALEIKIQQRVKTIDATT